MNAPDLNGEPTINQDGSQSLFRGPLVRSGSNDDLNPAGLGRAYGRSGSKYQYHSGFRVVRWHVPSALEPSTGPSLTYRSVYLLRRTPPIAYTQPPQ